MSRNTEYKFVSTDAQELTAKLISAYEKITGITVQPASPERLFIAWLASILVIERTLINYTGNQNLPSRAEGRNLDEVATLFYLKNRPPAKPSACTMRFYISEAQSTAVLIPVGTQVTDINGALIWQTIEDVYIEVGNLYADVTAQCTTVGKIGNGYAIGQINTIVNPFPYYERCENITMSDAGMDESNDDEFYELMRESEDAFSTAGPKGSYIYHAKKVSNEIADVVVNTPSDAQVNIYVLMKDGTIASSEIKAAVLEACNDEFVRPLTDYVVVDDPEIVTYDIEFTYYILKNLPVNATEVENAINEAVNDYVKWQCGKLGRDINPDELIQRVKSAGAKRLVLTSPGYIELSDGQDNTVPQIAQVGTITVTNGGYEDE